jgi:hypothetical protein
MRFILGLILALWTSAAFAQPVSPYGGLTCDSSVTYDASAAAASEIVPARTGARIYICRIAFFVGATATNVSLVYGTGVNCATGTTNVTPAFRLAANSGIVLPSPVGDIVVPAGNALCVNTSAGNPVEALVTYSQKINQ